MDGFEGPTTWEEVDMQDLEKVMVKVTTAAMPSTDNKELARTLAMHAAAQEAENSDPLGLGQIDSRQINLVRTGSLHMTAVTNVRPKACFCLNFELSFCGSLAPG